jgi:hypothetical protein
VGIILIPGKSPVQKIPHTKLVVPLQMQNDFFENLHVRKIAGHFGQDRL